MKLNVEVDLEDFMDTFGGENLETMISDHVKAEVMKLVKKDPKYKAYINKKASDVLNSLEV